MSNLLASFFKHLLIFFLESLAGLLGIMLAYIVYSLLQVHVSYTSVVIAGAINYATIEAAILLRKWIESKLV